MDQLASTNNILITNLASWALLKQSILIWVFAGVLVGVDFEARLKKT